MPPIHHCSRLLIIYQDVISAKIDRVRADTAGIPKSEFSETNSVFDAFSEVTELELQSVKKTDLKSCEREKQIVASLETGLTY